MTKFKWANEETRQFLSRGYLPDGLTVEERVRIIADHAEVLTGIKGFADKFYSYMSKGWYSLSSPVWSNYATDRGLPVSCFGSWIGDSMDSILYTVSEVGMLSKFGGGCSGYIGELRQRGADIKDYGKSFGAVHFMELFDKLTDIVSQGSVRRGFFTPYLPIEHGDFDEFVGFGSDGHAIQTLTNGVTVTDTFLNDMIDGNTENRRRWAKVIQNRTEAGYPYVFFTDNVNNNTVDVYKNKNMKIYASNMCVKGDTTLKLKYLDSEFEMDIDLFDLFFNLQLFTQPIYTLSYNTETEKSEWKEVEVSAKTDVVEELFQIYSAYDKLLECTGNHKIFTGNRGYVRADELLLDDTLLSSDSSSFQRAYKIVKLSVQPTPVYDITVKDNHNFYANNILVHNCSEIALPSNKDESFVCVLSSMNALYYDDWKNTDAVETMTIFLDTVVTEFIDKVEQMTPEVQYFMKRVLKFAKNHRALGLGVLGWHSYLQSKSIAFESEEASDINKELFETINERAWTASRDMAEWWGEPEVLAGYGRRNTTLTAVAPTKSSSAILEQVSMGIEPEFSNYYVKSLAKSETTVKNKYLKKVLQKYNQDNRNTWDSIRDADGSVQHIGFLSEHERNVFKTIYEISPESIINQAAIRQPHIDQGQSLNIMIDPDMHPKEINKLYLMAWQLGVKTLYYQYNMNASQQLARQKTQGCKSCEA